MIVRFGWGGGADGEWKPQSKQNRCISQSTKVNKYRTVSLRQDVNYNIAIFHCTHLIPQSFCVSMPTFVNNEVLIPRTTPSIPIMRIPIKIIIITK